MPLGAYIAINMAEAALLRPLVVKLRCESNAEELDD